MCESCGCNREEPFHVHAHSDTTEHGHAHSTGYHSHRHKDGHVHVHAHSDHEHEHDEGQGARRTIDVHQSLLSANDRAAEQNRGYFRAKNVRVINVISSPGAGKTALIKQSLAQLEGDPPVAVIVGDLATENDAARLRGHGAEIVQITTGTLCHLDARMVASAVDSIDLEPGSLLFIENVGNLVCPASFDLGEAERVVLFSVTEGEDKPLKYPPVFKGANLVVVTKIDLAEATEFDRESALDNLRRMAPQATIIELSSKTGEGMDAWFAFLNPTTTRERKHNPPATPQGRA